MHRKLLAPILLTPLLASAQCPDYSTWSTQIHSPVSSGNHALSWQRPSSSCRTFTSPLVEDTLRRLESVIADPDLYRLFQNTYPNTLDTAIKWRGHSADNAAEELTFVITGDINAMWLRDSANQLQSYLPLLKASNDTNSLASLYRGVINLQARYLLTSPYCNSFQPPPESNIPRAENGAANNDNVVPGYSEEEVFECKYEVDSLAAFLQISADYHGATGDAAFFSRFSWVRAVEAVLKVAEDMKTPTFAADGRVLKSPYTFTRLTGRATETLANEGVGNPVARDIGLVRSAFRPSDDATIYQFFVPGNMMFSVYLDKTAGIMRGLKTGNSTALAGRMEEMARGIRQAVERHGVVRHPVYGVVYAYEVDGFGSANIMDDANIPSLLSAPFFGYPVNETVYANTRRMLLSPSNPYYFRGPVLSAIGGPHAGLGKPWPMASIVRILTSRDEKEVEGELGQLVRSTARLGLMHESVDAWDEGRWTRQWFSWANGLFGQMMLGLEGRMKGVLGRSYQ
ncbi:glycoside hydrolase family 125 protein [Sporormia fimetaria CBS 119925]|uniref:Glycoside hydrolase family 125 protein n=1 Tax=Sporormia fimetaria CBS 119925 TaxID=1340428 RepID=A0A6A6V095_9PLEO|nr:glycoside hydrolase family 125 protein [Sporormia fimetaria CBS 119925]